LISNTLQLGADITKSPEKGKRLSHPFDPFGNRPARWIRIHAWPHG